jgi:hypothetical protein
MPPAALETSFPISITILSFIATGVLVAILFLLIVINSKLSMLSAKLSHPTRPTRPAKTEESEEIPPVVEAPSGTHFEEFLNEDAGRRKLTKKEQFKAYRAWRTEKGLNWSK